MCGDLERKEVDLVLVALPPLPLPPPPSFGLSRLGPSGRFRTRDVDGDVVVGEEVGREKEGSAMGEGEEEDEEDCSPSPTDTLEGDWPRT